MLLWTLLFVIFCHTMTECAGLTVLNVPLLHHLHKLPSHEETTAERLSHGDKRCQFFISHFLKGTQQTSLEEHLIKQKMKMNVCPLHLTLILG